MAVDLDFYGTDNTLYCPELSTCFCKTLLLEVFNKCGNSDIWSLPARSGSRYIYKKKTIVVSDPEF